MAYVVTDACMKDFRCVDECAMGGIAPGPNDPDAGTASQVYIDADVCVECGACMMVCEHNAILSQDQLKANQKHFNESNAAFFKNRAI